VPCHQHQSVLLVWVRDRCSTEIKANIGPWQWLLLSTVAHWSNSVFIVLFCCLLQKIITFDCFVRCFLLSSAKIITCV
jgi:hypothetical protein